MTEAQAGAVRGRSAGVRERRRRLVRQIYELEREILALQEGGLERVLQMQNPAPSCTICEQVPPGKPGEPTPVAELIRPLQRRLNELERQLTRLTRTL